MNYELLFSVGGALAMLGWVSLLVSPLIPKWSDRVAGIALPVLLSALYVFIAFQPNETGGGFETFAAVTELFSNPSALLAGWIHFLAFDLLVGAWICRTGRAENIAFLWVIPTLPLTFLFGPAGFLAFCAVRFVSHWRRGEAAKSVI